MTQPVFQSLLMDHIWMLLLFQRMFWDGQVLMLLYLIVDHLYDASIVSEDFSRWSRIPPIIKRLNTCSLWSCFEWSTVRKFSVGPALSTGPFQKVQLEVIYFNVVRKNDSKNRWISIIGQYNFWESIKSNIHCVWNWNCWTLFGSKIEVRGAWPSWLPSGYAPGIHPRMKAHM